MLGGHPELLQEPNLAGAFTRFYCNIIHSFSGNSWEKYLPKLEQVSKQRSKTIDQKLVFFRTAALLFESRAGANISTELWQMFLELYTKLHAPCDLLKAILFTHIGTRYLKEAKERLDDCDCRFCRNKSKKEYQNAVNYFKQSLSCQPQEKTAYLKLAETYELFGESSNLNKLLDKMIKLFPEDTATLKRAGSACLRRKSYAKGVKYLKHALQQNPIDSELRLLLLQGYSRLAEYYFKREKLENARRICHEATENAQKESNNVFLGLAWFYVRWAGMEFRFGDSAVAEEKLECALAVKIPQVPLFYFIARILERDALRKKRAVQINKQLLVLLKTKPNIEEALSLLKVISHFTEERYPPSAVTHTKKLANYVSSAADSAVTREQAAELVSLALDPLIAAECNDLQFNMAKVFISKMLSCDKNDPLFLFYRHEHSRMNKYKGRGKPELIRLDELLDLAMGRNDRLAVTVLKNEIHRKAKQYLGSFPLSFPSDLDDMPLPPGVSLDDVFGDAINDALDEAW